MCEEGTGLDYFLKKWCRVSLECGDRMSARRAVKTSNCMHTRNPNRPSRPGMQGAFYFAGGRALAGWANPSNDPFQPKDFLERSFRSSPVSKERTWLRHAPTVTFLRRPLRVHAQRRREIRHRLRLKLPHDP